MFNKTKIANCPKCGQQWLWSWTYDAYFYPDGRAVTAIEMKASEPDNNTDVEATAFQCDCGAVNSTYVVHPGGAQVVNMPEWSEVNWEDEENDSDAQALLEGE